MGKSLRPRMSSTVYTSVPEHRIKNVEQIKKNINNPDPFKPKNHLSMEDMENQI